MITNLFTSNFNLFIKKSLFLFPIIFIIVFINYKYDPAYLFKNKEYANGIVSIFNSGKNVANISDYNERLVQRYYAEKLNKPKDLLIIGSSRAMQLGSEQFQGRSLYNSSMSGIQLEEIAAIYEMYQVKNMLPKTIVIGLDPWLMNRSDAIDSTANGARWEDICDYYYLYTGTARGIKDKVGSLWQIFNKYSNIISLSYFQTSFKKFTSKGNTDNDYYATDRVDFKEDGKLWDGRNKYSDKYAYRSVTDVRLIAVKYAQEKSVYKLDNFLEIDNDRRAFLEELIKRMQSKHIKVMFFLTPYHPAAYKILANRPDTKIIIAVEALYRELSHKHNIPLIGSYNPENLNLVEADFYDGMHIKPSGIKRIFQKTN